MHFSYHKESNVYCFSGSHCTGKTTLITSLLEKNKDFILSPSNSTDIKTDSTISTAEIQLALVKREQETLNDLLTTAKFQTVLKDRCLLDTLIYSRYFFRRGLVSAQDLYFIESILEILFRHYYRRVFILPVGNINYTERDKFSMKEDTRDEIAELFLEYYEQNKRYLPLTLVTELSLEDRITKVESLIDREHYNKL